MKLYLHNATASESLDCDLKSVVPDALMRRRMSQIVRNGVTAASVCAGSKPIDAIITATAYGCLADSEKFLHTLIESDEELLSPTPFIQSTFNTIGATFALLQQNHCYNTTYAHGAESFAAAMLDAAMLLEEGEARQVLVGAVEEVTPTLLLLLERMQVKQLPKVGGAYFFRLSSDPQGARTELTLTLRNGSPQSDCSDPLAIPRQLYQAFTERQAGKFHSATLEFDLRCI